MNDTPISVSLTPVSRRFSWLAYASAMFLGRLLEVCTLHLRGSLTGMNIAGAALTLWFLVGVVGYGLDKPLGRPGLWTITYALAYLVTAASLLQMATVTGVPGASIWVYMTIAQAPLLYALWAYQREEHPRWTVTKDAKRAT